MSKALLSVKEAAEMYGKTRQAIWRAAKSGKLPSKVDSHSGIMKIQVVDLLSHYGEPPRQSVKKQQPSTVATDTEQHLHATVHKQEIEHLKVQLELAQERIKELKEQAHELRSEKERLFLMVERQQLLLEHKPQPSRSKERLQSKSIAKAMSQVEEVSPSLKKPKKPATKKKSK